MAGISSDRTIVHVQINGKYLISLVGSKVESRLLIISSLLTCLLVCFLSFVYRETVIHIIS